MATSGDSTFELNTDQICTEALEMNGAVPAGNNPTQANLESAKRSLNAIVKAKSGSMKMLFKVEETVLPLVASSVVLGTDGFDYECIKPHISAADTRPVTGAKYQAYWKKLATATGGAWVTATSYKSISSVELDDDVVGVGNGVSRLGVVDTTIYTHITKEEYSRYGNKTTKGTTNNLFFQRRRQPIIGGTGTEAKNRVFLYPYPDSTTPVIVLETYRFAEDFNIAANTPDFLQEYTQWLTFELAVKMHFKLHNLDPAEFSQLKKERDSIFKEAEGLDEETGDVFMSPDLT